MHVILNFLGFVLRIRDCTSLLIVICCVLSALVHLIMLELIVYYNEKNQCTLWNAFENLAIFYGNFSIIAFVN